MSALEVKALKETRVAFVGLGGLGSPAALALARSGVGSMTLIDDDSVDASNLHRQILFTEKDVGLSKIAVGAARLEEEARGRGYALKLSPLEARVLPDTALALLADHDVVIEGADNFATKFLVADACAVLGIPAVQAGVVRWSGWVLASGPRLAVGGPACLRCVFEDIPKDRADTCAEAGVVGAACGVIGGLQALLTLRLLSGDRGALGELLAYDAKRGHLRRTTPRPREACPRCRGETRDLALERYAPPECAL